VRAGSLQIAEHVHKYKIDDTEAESVMVKKGTNVESLIQELEAALFVRDIATGFHLLNGVFEETLNPVPKVSISLLLCVAQWVDLGYRTQDFVDALEAANPIGDLATLPLLDYLKAQMVEGYRLLATERTQEAINVLGVVLQIGDRILGDYLRFLANFWKGRAHRKLGDYESAASNFTAARDAAEHAGAAKLMAVTKIHESWLAFQSGKRQYAFDLLTEAEIELLPTGHSLSLGNIQSARGRFVRRSGDYAGALHHFEAAMKLYEIGCPDHPNMARALVNAAYVKRLMSLELQPRDGQAMGTVHAKSLRMSREALALLERAGRIYGLHHHQSGSGAVLVNAAHIHLECGDIDRAATEAQRAYDLAQEKSDQILMARAKAVHSAVELARSEEQLGDEPNIGLHAHAAVDHADTAIALALHTQNKRLLCEAYMARGLIAASDFFQDWELAKELVGKAAVLLTHDDRDHLYKQLGGLKGRLAGATHIDTTLRAWCDGQVGDKTFQQVLEEFAELVIPKIWLRSGKNITLVAKNLSISPKKVRRILRSTNKI
jgi:tetratricopeptide (TPR) repeat protein